jgi:TetR/AcrR family tetracycline transcriptional repressor
MAEANPEPLPGRGRGNRAGLTRARIVEAARGLDSAHITVQAVADRLGVNRAAVHHHISDLDTLRELIAFDAFTVNFAPVTIPTGATWQDACRILAISMHDGVLASGGLGAYVRLNPLDVDLLTPVEDTLELMMHAGFDDETAARGLAALASIAAAAAREHLNAERPSGHPQVPELQQALAGERGSGFAILRRLADADLVSFNESQFRTSIDLLIDGMATRLGPTPE